MQLLAFESYLLASPTPGPLTRRSPVCFGVSNFAASLSDKRKESWKFNNKKKKQRKNRLFPLWSDQLNLNRRIKRSIFFFSLEKPFSAFIIPLGFSRILFRLFHSFFKSKEFDVLSRSFFSPVVLFSDGFWFFRPHFRSVRFWIRYFFFFSPLNYTFKNLKSYLFFNFFSFFVLFFKEKFQAWVFLRSDF